MRLLYQSLGAIVAVVVVTRLLLPGSGRGRYMVGCLAVAAAVTSALALTSIDSQLRVMTVNRRDYKSTEAAGFRRHQKENLTGEKIGVNTQFSDWVLQRIPGHDTYYLAMTPSGVAGSATHWLTWRMLPHVPTAIEGQNGAGGLIAPSAKKAAEADWIVFYGVDPRRWSLRKQVRVKLQRYSKFLAIGKVRS
jgi:hypothetical protein